MLTIREKILSVVVVLISVAGISNFMIFDVSIFDISSKKFAIISSAPAFFVSLLLSRKYRHSD